MNQSTKLIQKLKQRDKERQLCYRKVGRAITKGEAIEKMKNLNLSKKPLAHSSSLQIILQQNLGEKVREKS